MSCMFIHHSVETLNQATVGICFDNGFLFIEYVPVQFMLYSCGMNICYLEKKSVQNNFAHDHFVYGD